MSRSNNRSFVSTTRLYTIFFGCVVLGLFLFSCSSMPPLKHELQLEEMNAPKPRYSMVFIIHGDGEYLYHDSRGAAHRADEKAVVTARIVAERNLQAEVFIFHQKRRRHAMLFFPRRDGEFYYYRHGKLLARESYWRNRGVLRFDPEVMLYRRFHAQDQDQLLKLFLYFGHEIPEFAGTGYDASYKNRRFTVRDLASGLKSFTSDSSKFDLIVLSTCNNGTPYTIAELSPYTRTIIASPDNLHLSYLDIRPLEELEIGLNDGDVPAFARQFAHQAFGRLTQDIQTAITVAVYDAEHVQGYLNAVANAYHQALIILQGQKQGAAERCDCATIPQYTLPGMSAGVDVFYRPPRFGRQKHNRIHSGWECWKLPEQSSDQDL